MISVGLQNATDLNVAVVFKKILQKINLPD